MNEKIKKWKKEHHNVFKVTISGTDFYYRTLTIGEISEVVSFYGTGNNIFAENLILEAVLHPLDFLPDSVGYLTIENLVECITISSKLFEIDSIKNTIKESRKWIKDNLNNDLFQWKMVLLGIFPGYTIEALDSLTPDKFFRLLILAEEVSGKKLINIDGLKNKKVHNEPELPTRDANINSGGKFLDQRQMEEEAANESFNTLREVYTRQKKSGKEK